MAISETNLRLVKSERMTDFSDGGGKMTGNEVVDGEVNNIFNDISQLDRTYGRVSLKKVYGLVETANTDTYLGAHIILTDPPDDPHVNVTAFTTGSWTDQRDAAKNRIESYSIAGPEAQWILYGDHVEGQKLVMLFSRSNAASLVLSSPEASVQVGDVLDLSVEKTGFTPKEQYVRVYKIVSRETQQFTDGAGNFFKDILIIEIANPLRGLFQGATPTRALAARNDAASSPTLVRTTSVADAAQYFGVKKLTQALSINTLTVNIGSPYSALVPSAQAETPLIDINANMTRPNYVQAGSAGALTKSATVSGSVAPDYPGSLYMGRGFKPGSLVLSIGGVAYKDNAAGSLVLANGSTGTYGGTVDYASGCIRVTKGSAWPSVGLAASATPASVTYDSSGTDAIKVTLNNRAFNYVRTLKPNPTPGSLVIDFKALNKWYRLYDDGLGRISGVVSGLGSGTINYATGSVLVTLTALPDIDSSILFAWSTPAAYTVQTYAAQQPRPYIHIDLVNTPVTPGSLAIAWTNGGSKTATAAANGTLSGDATGKLVHANGHLTFKPNVIPTSGTEFTVTYTQLMDKTDTFSVTGDAGGTVTCTLSQLPVKPGSVKLNYSLQVNAPNYFGAPGVLPITRSMELHDDGAGHIIFQNTGIDGGLVISNPIAGTINYATGAITTDMTQTHVMSALTGFDAFFNAAVYTDGIYDDILPPSTTLTAHYAVATDTPVEKIESVSLDSLLVDLATTTSESLLEGSLQFSYAGSTFIDRNGILYRDHNALNDSATASGTIDYQTGLATLTQFPGGSPTLTIESAASIKGLFVVSGVVGRAPGAPLATGQFQLNCVGQDGTVISVSADNNGDLEHEWVRGSVDWTTGIFAISFGKSVADSSLSADVKAHSGWYNAANVVNGNIWVPYLVKPETITFNAVLVSYIPLDASILGVETVRLPQDGRVPIYRVGNVGVVHNTQILTLSNPAIAGSSHNCGRTLLSYAKLFDANSVIIPTSKYTADLDAGTLTLANPLDLTGFVQPLHIEHRIEDMALITDVQITGQVQLMKPVRHAYPANTSYFSSAMVIGDLQARYANLFDQQTWASVFSDDLSGSAATVSFNDVLYPLAVTNAGTIQERWAIVFTSTTAFNCYGEYSGLVAQGSTGVNFAPVNPDTNSPYFTMDYRGWGAGWSAGNVLRFNTVAANFPLWLARTTLQSDPTVYTDNFKLQIRGDSN